MSKKNRRIKNTSPKPPNQLPSPSPEPFSQHLERLHRLVEERLIEEYFDRGEMILKLSAKFQSFNNFIEYIMLVMLWAKKLSPTKNYSDLWEALLDERFKYFLADNQVRTSLLTDGNLIKMLLTDNLLIDMIFEYVFDPIKLDRKLIVDRMSASLSWKNKILLQKSFQAEKK